MSDYIYRLSYYASPGPQDPDYNDGHSGYEYTGTLKEAKEDKARSIEDAGYGQDDIRITKHKTPQNKEEIIALLQLWGSHPDNG